MIAEGYEMHLYCESCQALGVFSGPKRSDCTKQAKRRGWIIRGQECWCIHCPPPKKARVKNYE